MMKDALPRFPGQYSGREDAEIGGLLYITTRWTTLASSVIKITRRGSYPASQHIAMATVKQTPIFRLNKVNITV